MAKYKSLLYSGLIMAIAMMAGSSCQDETPAPGGGNGNSSSAGELSYDLGGVHYKVASFLADYGAKIYITGLDEDGNLLVDFALPAQKGKLMPSKKFTIADMQTTAKGLVYVDNHQWGMEGGSVTITKHGDNRVSGNFSGMAYELDYQTNPPTRTDSAMVTNGVFTDVLVKDQ